MVLSFQDPPSSVGCADALLCRSDGSHVKCKVRCCGEMAVVAGQNFGGRFINCC